MDAVKVLICGTIFNHADKAPYVESGKSILGALEVDEREQWVRCHECGKWCSHLGQHIGRSHEMLVDDYKQRHGLRRTTRMTAPGIKKKVPGAAFGPQRQSPGFRVTAEAIAKANTSRQASKRETQNLNNRCVAQIKVRVADLYQELGRKPTVRELAARGLYHHYLASYLNSKTLDEILVACGVDENAPRKEQNPITANVRRRLVQCLRDAYARKGSPLVMEDCKPPFLPCVKVFKRAFGSWMDALEAAGIPISSRSEGAAMMWQRRSSGLANGDKERQSAGSETDGPRRQVVDCTVSPRAMNRQPINSGLANNDPAPGQQERQ